MPTCYKTCSITLSSHGSPLAFSVGKGVGTATGENDEKSFQNCAYWELKKMQFYIYSYLKTCWSNLSNLCFSISICFGSNSFYFKARVILLNSVVRQPVLWKTASFAKTRRSCIL